MPTLLITSAGSLVADAVMTALQPVRDRLTIVGVNSVAAPVAFMCDRLHRVPPVCETAAFDAALCAVIEAERPDLVIAGRDEDVPALAALAAGNRFPHTVFPVPSPSLAWLLQDKRACHRFACDHRLPFAPTAADPRDARALAAEHGYPLLAKPWRGSGSRDVWLLADERDLAAATADPALMVQAFCGPETVHDALRAFRATAERGLPWRWAFLDEEINAELTLAADGTIDTLCLDTGETAPPFRTGIRLIDEDPVATVARAWGAALGAHGYRGPLNIQGKRMPDGRFLPYEINPRFGGSAAVRAALGHNQVLHLVAGVLGWPVPPMAARPGTTTLWTRSVDLPAGRSDAFAAGALPPALAAGDQRRSASPSPGAGGAPHAASPAGSLAATLGCGAAGAARFARAHGLPFVDSATTIAEAAALVRRTGLPLIAKPCRGDGTVLVLERWEQVGPALGPGGVVVQHLLQAPSLQPQREAWRTRPGAPWTWHLQDTAEVAEIVIAPDGGIAGLRVAAVTQRGGRPVEIRPIAEPAVAGPACRWARALSRAGYRGPLRLCGKRGDRSDGGGWLPYAIGTRLLGIPDAGTVRSLVAVPIVAVDPVEGGELDGFE